jgi:endogenous inhibitor of DNA gyrase (YacG/DUF329 family)
VTPRIYFFAPPPVGYTEPVRCHQCGNTAVMMWASNGEQEHPFCAERCIIRSGWPWACEASDAINASDAA